MMTNTEAQKKAREDGVIFLPDSFYQRYNINPRAFAPSWLAPQHVILDSNEAIQDLLADGRARKPGNLTVIDRKDGSAPVLLVHDNKTEAAEIEELAHEALKRKPIDFKESRAHNGKMDAKDFDAALKQAAEDIVKKAKRNCMTMHPRDPRQQFVRGLVTVPAMDWIETSRREGEKQG